MASRSFFFGFTERLALMAGLNREQKQKVCIRRHRLHYIISHRTQNSGNARSSDVASPDHDLMMTPSAEYGD